MSGRETAYPLAPQGVFATIQGEGALLGLPMVFVRLAGCSVGCSNCDTDYRVRERATAKEIHTRVEAVRGKSEWVWVTGGEPTDHDLEELIEVLRPSSYIALATSGTRLTTDVTRCHFLSVSPHGTPSDLQVRCGSQINLVPGLNGLRLSDWENFYAGNFEHRFVTPLWRKDAGCYEYLLECLDWIAAHPGWRLGIQAHRFWGLP